MLLCVLLLYIVFRIELRKDGTPWNFIVGPAERREAKGKGKGKGKELQQKYQQFIKDQYEEYKDAAYMSDEL